MGEALKWPQVNGFRGLVPKHVDKYHGFSAEGPDCQAQGDVDRRLQHRGGVQPQLGLSYPRVTRKETACWQGRAGADASLSVAPEGWQGKRGPAKGGVTVP